MKPKTDLKELAARESEQVEWKKNVANIEDVIRTITAFSSDFQNMGGGYVVCGAEESKDEHGFQRVTYPGLKSDRFKEIEGKVMSDAREKIDPAVTPIVDELPGEIDGQRVLVFIVPATGYAHSYRPSGKDSAAYYVRLSRETVEAKNGVLRELLVRKQALPPWDRRLSELAGISDVDMLAFREMLQQVGVWNPSVAIEDYFADSMRISDFVPPLGGKRPLDEAVHPRNFALLLFGKEPTRFFPGAWTKVSFYPGKDRSEQTAERHELTGTVVGQAKKTLELLKTHASIVYDKKSAKPNASKYPERALQEAVINAIVHRDYEQEEPTSITVFADRVEIRSPGALPRAVNKEKFLAGKASPSWRNQSLAYFFNKLQLAQAEGQGIATIIRTLKQLGSPPPRFDLEKAAVTCVLPAHPRHEMMRNVAGIETPISRYRDIKKSRPEAVGMLIEGDSWYVYPMLVSTNIVNELKKFNGNAIVQLDASHSGDDAREILCGGQFAYLYRVMAEEMLSFDCILFSGGGNDIVAQNLPVLLNSYKPGMTWEGCLNMPRFRRRLSEIEDVYLDLADLRDDYQPTAWIFTHGYDYAIPIGEGFKVLGVTVAGKWIKARMDSKNIPEKFQRKILDYMLAEFDKMLIRLEQTVPRFVHVRTQGTLKDSEWANELHPTPAGFRKITNKFQVALAGVFPRLSKPRRNRKP